MRFAPPNRDLLTTASARQAIAILYLLFMTVVQLLMLNLLVAIMSYTLSRLRGSEKLMARHVRARLVLDLEQVLLSKIQLLQEKSVRQENSNHARRLSASHALLTRAVGWDTLLVRLISRARARISSAPGRSFDRLTRGGGARARAHDSSMPGGWFGSNERHCTWYAEPSGRHECSSRSVSSPCA